MTDIATSLPPLLRARAVSEGRAAAHAKLQDGTRPVCPYEFDSPSLTRRRLSNAWWDGYHEVDPIPDEGHWV